MNKDILYDYFLHYNHLTGYWNAVNRDKSVHYMNGTLKEGEVLKNKDINVLVDYIVKTGNK